MKLIIILLKILSESIIHLGIKIMPKGAEKDLLLRLTVEYLDYAIRKGNK